MSVEREYTVNKDSSMAGAVRSLATSAVSSLIMQKPLTRSGDLACRTDARRIYSALEPYWLPIDVKALDQETHILEQSLPPFIVHLRGGDWERAAREFADYAYRVLKPWNTGIFAAFDEDQREDVKQDIILRYIDDECRRLKMYSEEPGVPFLHWFRKGVRFLALNARLAVMRQNSRTSELDNTRPLASRDPDPGELTEWRELISIVEQELLSINRKYRVLIRASVHNGYSSKKIAVIMGYGSGTEAVSKVSKDVHTAKKALRLRLKKRGLSDYHTAEDDGSAGRTG